MANTNLTIDMVTQEAARVLVNQLGFARTIDREYDDSFGNSGAKIGQSIRLRKPPRYKAVDGATLGTNRDSVEEQSTLTLTNQVHVPLEFSSKEMTLDIDDFSDRYIVPAAAQLANKVDRVGLELYSSIANATGTPGTTPATAAAILDAGVKLDENSTPRDGQRCLGVDPYANAALVDGLKGLFNDSSIVGDQYRKGSMGMDTLGFKEIYMDQNVVKHTCGDFAGTVLIDDASIAEGDTTIHMDAFTSTAPAPAAGDVFTIAGVNGVNRQNYESTGQLQQFVVVSVANAATNECDVTFYPAIKASSTDPQQTVTALPADNAAVTWLGTSATAYPQNMAYHKDAFVLGCADLVMPKGVDMAARAVQDDISVRIVQDYDITEDRFLGRLDILFGYSVRYPELASRMYG